MNTHTNTLLTSWSLDMSITKEEIIDVNVLSHLCRSDDLSAEDHTKLRSLKRKLVRGRYLDSVYKLGKNVKSEDSNLGRLCVLRGIGLQSLPKQIRSALAQTNYWDVDMVAAHPTLMQQLCEKYGIACEKQKVFLLHRDKYRTELAEHLQVDDGRVKERINALYFGFPSACSGMPEFFTALQAEIIKARELIVGHSDWVDAVKFLRGKENKAGRALSYILQTIERSVLLELDKSATRNHRSLDVYIHDGGLVRKLDNEKVFPIELLRTFESDIQKAIGYTIRLAVKPLHSDLDIETMANTNYNTHKAEFENTCFKINNPACYIRIYDNKISVLDMGKLGHIYANDFVDAELFINKWRADPNILTYERVDFLPELTAPFDVFNLWRGFQVEPIEGDISVIQRVLMTLCDNDKAAFDYIENWVAHLFQKPYEKPGVCIVIQSDDEGAGKDTYGNHVGDMLGSNMFFNTSRPEETVFGRFNGSLKETLFIKLEEADFETNKKNEGHLKSSITCESNSYESKNENAMTIKSYSRFMMTTNIPVPFVMSDSNRRFMVVKASSEMVGNRSYWSAVHKTLNTPESKSAYFHYLKNKDISNFNPRDFPATAYSDELRCATRPLLAQFFQREIEKVDDGENNALDVTMDWKARELFTRVNEVATKYPMSETRFGREMNKFKDVIEKLRNNGAHYRYRLEDMKAFLVKKHWWVEL